MDVLTEQRAVLGESPLWHRSEAMFYWVDIATELVFSYDPQSGRAEVEHRGLMVTALCETEGGGLIMVTSRGLFSLRDGGVDRLVALELSDEVRTNDGKADPRGRVWFGTMDLEATRPVGELFVFDGQELRRVQDQVILSNGLGWSPN